MPFIILVFSFLVQDTRAETLSCQKLYSDRPFKTWHSLTNESIFARLRSNSIAKNVEHQVTTAMLRHTFGLTNRPLAVYLTTKDGFPGRLSMAMVYDAESKILSIALYGIELAATSISLSRQTGLFEVFAGMIFAADQWLKKSGASPLHFELVASEIKNPDVDRLLNRLGFEDRQRIEQEGPARVLELLP